MAISFSAGNPAATQFCVPPGDYRVKIIEAKEDTSKGGNDMIRLKLRVLNEDGSDGPSFFDYLVFAASSFWRIDQFLKSVGRHPGEGEAIDIDASELVGLQCETTLIVENYNGNDGNKIGSYLSESDEF